MYNKGQVLIEGYKGIGAPHILTSQCLSLVNMIFQSIALSYLGIFLAKLKPR